MALIFDDFTKNQFNPDTLANNGTYWNPPTGTRALPGPNGVINGGVFSVSSQSGVPNSLIYNYGQDYDFTTLSVVTLNLAETTNNNVTMTFTSSITGAQSSTKHVLPGDTTVSWTKTDFPTTNFATITGMTITVASFFSGFNYALTASSLTSLFVCLAHDTQILLANNTYKSIQDLHRGDVVASHDKSLPGHKIARVLYTELHPRCDVDIVRVSKNALGENLPFAETFITGWHPILYKNQRKPAKCFQNIPGFKFNYNDIKAKDILPKADDDAYYLYNLQFDHEGLFMANGLSVQAVSPWSNICPLPEKLFYNYVEKPLTTESYITDYEWNQELLTEL